MNRNSKCHADSDHTAHVVARAILLHFAKRTREPLREAKHPSTLCVAESSLVAVSAATVLSVPFPTRSYLGGTF